MAQFAGDHEPLVVGENDPGQQPGLELVGECDVPVEGEPKQVGGDSQLLAVGRPVEVGHGAGPGEVEALTVDHRLGQLLVQARLEKRGAAFVNGPVLQNWKVEAEPDLAISLGSVVVVGGQRVAARVPVAAEDRAAPDAGKLLEADIGRPVLVVARRGPKTLEKALKSKIP